VHLRRRWPVVTAVVVTVLSAVSTLAAGPACLAAVSLATRRRWPELVGIGALSFSAAEVYTRTHDISGSEPWWLTLILNLLVVAVLLGWGMYIGSRRELIWTLRHRAERAEAEQELRAARAQSDERGRIAREMHDVLAHRISQISLQSAALAYRTDLDEHTLRSGVGEIQDMANAALTDLRDVLGVLRDSTGALADRPQPTYADIAALVEQARAEGTRLEHVDEIDGVPPASTGRAAYRIVQEAITNARKHAPGALVRISLTGSPSDGVDVRVSNPLGFGSRVPGAGVGLIGLVERAHLRGGSLEHRAEEGEFVLHAWLPWAA
jgi:signal transduction histidine kinase